MLSVNNEGSKLGSYSIMEQDSRMTPMEGPVGSSKTTSGPQPDSTSSFERALDNQEKYQSQQANSVKQSQTDLNQALNTENKAPIHDANITGGASKKAVPPPQISSDLQHLEQEAARTSPDELPDSKARECVSKIVGQGMNLTKTEHWLITYIFRAIYNFFAKNPTSLEQNDFAKKTKTFINNTPEFKIFLNQAKLSDAELKVIIKEAISASNTEKSLTDDNLNTYAESVLQAINNVMKSQTDEDKKNNELFTTAKNFCQPFQDLLAPADVTGQKDTDQQNLLAEFNVCWNKVSFYGFNKEVADVLKPKFINLAKNLFPKLEKAMYDTAMLLSRQYQDWTKLDKMTSNDALRKLTLLTFLMSDYLSVTNSNPDQKIFKYVVSSLISENIGICKKYITDDLDYLTSIMPSTNYRDLSPAEYFQATEIIKMLKTIGFDLRDRKL